MYGSYENCHSTPAKKKTPLDILIIIIYVFFSAIRVSWFHRQIVFYRSILENPCEKTKIICKCKITEYNFDVYEKKRKKKLTIT